MMRFFLTLLLVCALAFASFSRAGDAKDDADAPHTPIEAKTEDVKCFEARLRPGMNHRNAVYAAMIKSFDENVGRLQPYYFHAHLAGSEGSILDNKFHSQKLGGLNKHSWSQISMKMLDSGDVSDHPYQTPFQAFFDALEEGRDMPLTSFSDAFKSHRVIAAADRSAAESRLVKLSEIAEK